MADSSKTGDENELMLELSIGGIFGKADRNASKSTEIDGRNQDLNVQTKGEIQALRRRELRRKREEKLKKSVNFGSCGSVNGPFVENKEWLETQIAGKNNGVLEVEPARKKEKIGNPTEKAGLIATTPVDDGGNIVHAPVYEDANFVFRPTTCRCLNPNPNEHEVDGGGRCYCKMKSNGCASSAYSDGQCSSHHGGTTDDSRSNSSNSLLDQQLASTSTASVDPLDPTHQPTDSSKQTVPATKLIDPPVPEPIQVKPNDHPNPHDSKPGTSIQQQQASLLARMPCVSTTGNGPNGKTVSGFLYRYTKNEVSIVCVCHGRSFSPAGFVEHAGGVDIAHPLKHITIYPAAFAS